MAGNNLLGIGLAIIVLVFLAKALGPEWKRPTRKRTRRRKVQVDPLLAKERKLSYELRQVRAQLRERDGSTRHI